MQTMRLNHVSYQQSVQQECSVLILQKNACQIVWPKCTRILQQEDVKTVHNTVQLVETQRTVQTVPTLHSSLPRTISVILTVILHISFIWKRNVLKNVLMELTSTILLFIAKNAMKHVWHVLVTHLTVLNASRLLNWTVNVSANVLPITMRIKENANSVNLKLKAVQSLYLLK